MIYEEEMPDLLDPLPEFCHYRDEGCEASPSCLKCPLATCIYDEKGGWKHFIKESRNAEIKKLYHKGVATSAIARQFGLSQRSIQRIVKSYGD
jgi:adenine-specific DNA glycosylase